MWYKYEDNNGDNAANDATDDLGARADGLALLRVGFMALELTCLAAVAGNFASSYCSFTLSTHCACLILLQLLAFVVFDVVVVVIVTVIVVAVVIVAAVLLNNIFSSKTRTHISSFVCQTRAHSNEQKSHKHTYTYAAICGKNCMHCGHKRR